MKNHPSTGALHREANRLGKTLAIKQGMMQQLLPCRVLLVWVFVPRSGTGGVTPQSGAIRIIPDYARTPSGLC